VASKRRRSRWAPERWQNEIEGADRSGLETHDTKDEGWLLAAAKRNAATASM
jgi:hypothetical protein